MPGPLRRSTRPEARLLESLAEFDQAQFGVRNFSLGRDRHYRTIVEPREVRDHDAMHDVSQSRGLLTRQREIDGHYVIGWHAEVPLRTVPCR